MPKIFKMFIYQITLVFFIAIIQKGYPLECYECTTFLSDKKCGDDFDPKGIKKVDCEGSQVCMVHVLPELTNAPEITQRGCIDKYYCSRVDELPGHCSICSEDLCNRSSVLNPATILLLISIIIIIKYVL